MSGGDWIEWSGPLDYQGHSQCITFQGDDGEMVGTLHLTDPMRFEGNADDAAKVFFERVVAQHLHSMVRLRELEVAVQLLIGFSPIDMPKFIKMLEDYGVKVEGQEEANG